MKKVKIINQNQGKQSDLDTRLISCGKYNYKYMIVCVQSSTFYSKLHISSFSFRVLRSYRFLKGASVSADEIAAKYLKEHKNESTSTNPATGNSPAVNYLGTLWVVLCSVCGEAAK